MTNQIAPIITGKELNVAARATRSVLDHLLADNGTSFPVHLTLTLVADGDGGSALSHPMLRQALATGLEVAGPVAEDVLDQVTTAGLVRWSTAAPDDGEARAELTSEGRALHERLATLSGQTAARLWRDIPAADLETTKRVLDLVTARAEAEAAG